MEADVDSTFGDTEKVELIKAVKEYRFMYDKVHIWYSDGAKRDTAWREIGSIIDHPANVCKLEWTSLVDGFKSSRKRKKVLRPWKFDALMDYLTPYININEDDKSNDSAVVIVLNDNVKEEQNQVDYLSDESHDPMFGIQYLPESPHSPDEDDSLDIPDLNLVYSPDIPDTPDSLDVPDKPDSSVLPYKKPNSDDDLPIGNELVNGTAAESIEELREPQTPVPIFVARTPVVNTRPVMENPQGDVRSRNEYLIFHAPKCHMPEVQQNLIHQNINGRIMNKEIEKVSSTSNTIQMGGHHKPTSTLKMAQKDEIDMFFTSMATTVKKFSPANRVMVKSKVFAVISEMEMAEIAKQH